ncbi:MAG: hypothetical protein OJF49_004732 [Ktedonobacterales bacterium]|nr:MAG: hypothetical protein OJF49_004732 [Ktedonobacterales bacterium]
MTSQHAPENREVLVWVVYPARRSLVNVRVRYATGTTNQVAVTPIAQVYSRLCGCHLAAL